MLMQFDDDVLTDQKLTESDWLLAGRHLLRL
jgi:hypothetical protein